jgi:hypothetical protein
VQNEVLRIEHGLQNVVELTLEEGLGRRAIRLVWCLRLHWDVGAWVALMDRVTSVRHESGELSPFLLVPLSLIGAVMMLFGVGEWGRWGYLLVFLSMPMSLSLLFLVPTGGKDVFVLVPTVSAVVSYIVVRRYYSRRKSRYADRA